MMAVIRLLPKQRWLTLVMPTWVQKLSPGLKQMANSMTVSFSSGISLADSIDRPIAAARAPQQKGAFYPVRSNHAPILTEQLTHYQPTRPYQTIGLLYCLTCFAG